MWATIPTVSAGSLAVLWVVMLGWGGSFSKLVIGGAAVCFGWGMFLLPVSAIIGIVFQSTVLALFIALNSRSKSPGHTLRSLWSAAWREYEQVIDPASFKVVGLIILLALLLWAVPSTFFVNVLRPTVVWLGEIIPLPFHPLLNLTLVVLAAAALVAFLWLVIAGRTVAHLKIAAKALGVIGLTALTFAAAGSPHLIKNFFVWVGVDDVDAVIARVLVVLLLLAVAASLVYCLSIILREVMKLSWRRAQVFPPGSILPAVWKQRLANSPPLQQNDLLLRTNHQSLGLKADEYLLLLAEVGPLIASEPALSTYWSQRDQLEQVLRQEREG